MGDYYRNSRMSVFEQSSGKQPTNDIARLYDARIITANESGESKRLDEELLKEITGGDPVTARFLYKESFTFHPQFKIWFAVNTLPKVNAYDHGFWRRVRIIPFTIRFDGKNCDKELYNKLKAELSGIMNWAYEGYVQWQKIGLAPPDEVLRATEKYHQQEDVIAQFIGDCISRTDSIENRIPAKDLCTLYSRWYDENFSEKVMSQQAFGKRMAGAGYKSEKIGGKRWYIGLETVGQ
jgi:putative DNA primase/helicase